MDRGCDGSSDDKLANYLNHHPMGTNAMPNVGWNDWRKRNLAVYEGDARMIVQTNWQVKANLA